MKIRSRLFVLLLLIALSALLVFYSSCSKNSVGSQVSFGPGVYKGIYKVVQHPQTPDELAKIDTMIFKFLAPDTFRMDWDSTVEFEHRFCNVRGKYIFGNDSLKISISFNVPGVCDTSEAPHAEYFYYIDRGTIIFKTSDTALSRRIELWQKL